ncbi:MAG: hypothetical protein J6V76_02005 [Bacteroidales bacterium]|nr:hypothetical protein [Bacteroidales bacterium]
MTSNKYKILRSRPMIFLYVVIGVHITAGCVIMWFINNSTVTIADTQLANRLLSSVGILLVFNLLFFIFAALLQRDKNNADAAEIDKLSSEVKKHHQTVADLQQTLREATNQSRLLQKELDMRQSVIKVYKQKIDDDAVQIAEATAQLSANRELLQKTRARAEVSDRYKSAFVACVSHEIHTPIHIIMGFADMLCRPNISPERRAEQTESLVAHSKRFLEVFDNIMLYSKIQSGDINISPQPFDLNFLLNGINMHADFLIKQSGKPLTIKFGCNFKEKKFITSFEEGLKIVLLKLIHNAVKFSAAGLIGVDYRITDTRILFSVTDSGIGIPPDRYSEIFESFYQVDNSLSRHYQGLGIGLSICKGLLNLMGGKITVDSQVGAGSTFTFDIPSQPPQHSCDLYSEISKAADVKPFHGSILLISDNDDDIRQLTQFFEKCGCSLCVARSYRQAFDMYKDLGRISFVMLDIDFPGVNTLAVELSQIDIQVKIIIISQPGADPALLASAPIVGRGVVSKPLTDSAVTDTVNNLLILRNETLVFSQT